MSEGIVDFERFGVGYHRVEELGVYRGMDVDSFAGYADL